MIKLNFRRELRLLTPFDFNFVFQDGFRSSSPYLTLVSRKNNLPHPRIGFAIAKKQIKRAHERNRIKRITREFFRLHQHTLPNVDLVVMAKHAAIDLDNAKLTKTLDSLCQRIAVKMG